MRQERARNSQWGQRDLTTVTQVSRRGPWEVGTEGEQQCRWAERKTQKIIDLRSWQHE